MWISGLVSEENVSIEGGSTLSLPLRIPVTLPLQTEFVWPCSCSLIFTWVVVVSECHLLAGHDYLYFSTVGNFRATRFCLLTVYAVCHVKYFLLLFLGFCWYFAQTNVAVINIFSYWLHWNDPPASQVRNTCYTFIYIWNFYLLCLICLVLQWDNVYSWLTKCDHTFVFSTTQRVTVN